MRLYSDYLHREYGPLGSDYVFVNLFAEPHGRPWGYAAVYDLVKRLRSPRASRSNPTNTAIPTPPGCCVAAPGWRR